MALVDPQLLQLLFEQVQRTRKQIGDRCCVLGVYGPQGSGKTTLSQALVEALHQQGLQAAAVSQDDFYLTQAQRQNLAQTIHPLLATRGVPGTHDLSLAISTVHAVLKGQATQLPVFDKAADEPLESTQWRSVPAKLDVLIVEGWCVAVPDCLHQDLLEFPQGINATETEFDSDAVWRQYVAAQNTQYQSLYRMLDYVIGFQIPDFRCVPRWRWQQEQDLFAKTGQQFFKSEAAVVDFVACFERVTRAAQTRIQQFSDAVIEVAEDHTMQLQYASNKRRDLSLNLTPEMQNALNRNHVLVFTDLDGTLLNHDSYDLGPVPDVLQELHGQGWHVVLNTSKTWAEVQPLQQRIGYFGPCIVENGGGIHVPSEAYWQPLVLNTELEGIQSRAQLNRVLDQIQDDFKFERMRDWSPKQVATYTGLSQENAVLANKRLYSEPLMWQDLESNLVRFREKVESTGLKLVRGGRFCHLMGDQDKSIAMARVVQLYEKDFGVSPLVLALGDNQNDFKMLEAADIACVLTLPSKRPMVLEHQSRVIYPIQEAPQGWSEAIQDVLSLQE